MGKPPETDPVFLKRAERADQAVRVVVAELVSENLKEEATDDVLAKAVVNPVLAGALAALADLAWDAAFAEQTVEGLCRAFAETARPHIEIAAKARPPGLIGRLTEGNDGTVN